MLSVARGTHGGRAGRHLEARGLQHVRDLLNKVSLREGKRLGVVEQHDGQHRHNLWQPAGGEAHCRLSRPMGHAGKRHVLRQGIQGCGRRTACPQFGTSGSGPPPPPRAAPLAASAPSCARPPRSASAACSAAMPPPPAPPLPPPRWQPLSPPLRQQQPLLPPDGTPRRQICRVSPSPSAARFLSATPPLSCCKRSHQTSFGISTRHTWLSAMVLSTC